MLEDRRGHTQAQGQGGWGNGTHDIGMIETLEYPHLALYTLGLQCDLACNVLGHNLGGGRAGNGAELRVAEGAVDGPAAWCSARGPLFWWYGPCRALPYAMTTMCYTIVLECIQLRGSHTYHFPNESVPRTSRMSCCLFLFADGGCAITFWETKRAHIVVVTLIASESVTMLSLDF